MAACLNVTAATHSLGLMNLYSGVIRHGVLPCVSLATRSEFWSLYKDLQRRESQPRRSAPSDVLQRVSSLLAHAYESVPFYRARMQAAGLTPDAPITLDDLRPLAATTQAHGAPDFPAGLAWAATWHQPT